MSSFRTIHTSLPSPYNYETLLISKPSQHVLQVGLNRPTKLNAMNQKFWLEMSQCFNEIAEDDDCIVVVTGEGRVFTAGLDLSDISLVQQIGGGGSAAAADDYDDDDENKGPDTGRKAFNIRKIVLKFQDAFTSIERCPKPVIAAVHGACVGAGVDLVT